MLHKVPSIKTLPSTTALLLWRPILLSSILIFPWLLFLHVDREVKEKWGSSCLREPSLIFALHWVGHLIDWGRSSRDFTFRQALTRRSITEGTQRPKFIHLIKDGDCLLHIFTFAHSLGYSGLQPWIPRVSACVRLVIRATGILTLSDFSVLSLD